jgi:glycosyltransferase involved in cell wall biosynthesis
MNVGGPALQVVGITEGLDQARFDHRLLVGNVGPDEADYLELRAPHVSAQRVDGLGRSPHATGDLRALGHLIAEMRRFRPHIVHTHTAKAGTLGRIAASLARVPIRVHTFHGHLLTGYFSPRVTQAVVLTERGLARGTTALVAVGSQVRDDLVAAGIGRIGQYTVVPPGVQLPPAPGRAAARRALDLPLHEPVIAFVARLTSVKRTDRFAAVARAVLGTHPTSVFIVAGEGDLLAELQASTRDLGDSVRFLGWRPDVETIYAAADLTLLTSDNEGMPVSLIEAATVGCPAVTTDVGSAREVVLDGETGLVVGTDADALAAAVRTLLDDRPRLDAMRTAAADHGRRNFGRDRLVRDTAELYERLAAEHLRR